MGMQRKEMPTVIWSPQGGTQVAVRHGPSLVGEIWGGHYVDPHHHTRDVWPQKGQYSFGEAGLFIQALARLVNVASH